MEDIVDGSLVVMSDGGDLLRHGEDDVEVWHFEKILWGGQRGGGNFVAASNRWSAAMPQPNDLSRSLVGLDHDSTIIAVVEPSQSSWLVGGVLPGIERQNAPPVSAGVWSSPNRSTPTKPRRPSYDIS